MRKTSRLLALILATLALAGCGNTVPSGGETATAQTDTENIAQMVGEAYIEAVVIEDIILEDEAVAMADAPAAVLGFLSTEASGEKVKKNDYAIIDYSNTEDGYVMVKYTAETAKRLKAQVKGPTTTYTYNLTPGKWEVFPLSDGNGSYKITVYQNVYDSKYSSVISLSCEIKLTDEFAPFLRPNQYVDHASAPNTVAKAAELIGNVADPLEKVAKVYDFVVSTLSYDYDKAASVKSGYVPVLDDVLAAKKGICFDYSALMAGMLRSQGVPCKLVVGYAGTTYHAWISVWTKDAGWIDGAIWFDGTAWHRMDPTFASSGQRSQSIMNYIAADSNYVSKYIY